MKPQRFFFFNLNFVFKPSTWQVKAGGYAFPGNLVCKSHRIQGSQNKLYVYGVLAACMSLCYVCAVPTEGSEVTEGCGVSCHVGAWEWDSVFRESSQCF